MQRIVKPQRPTHEINRDGREDVTELTEIADFVTILMALGVKPCQL
jgi:hypothetical protein